MLAAARALAKRLDPNRMRRTIGAASCVRERGRFVLNEMRSGGSLRQYGLRDADMVVQIRHPLLDMWVLEEVFRFRVYDPPPDAARRLNGLGRPLRVVDLGGHIGLFGLYARTCFPVESTVSFEPNPENARTLRACIEANGLETSWELIEACAATDVGSVDFEASFHLSRIARADEGLEAMQERIGAALPYLKDSALLETERRRVQTRDVFPYLADADLVKIDIEGGEWEILADPRFADLRAAAVVLEYHPTYGPHSDAEAAVRGAFERAGYECGAPLPGEGRDLVWAWRRSPAATGRPTS